MRAAAGPRGRRGGSDYEPSANAPGSPYQRGIRYLTCTDNSIDDDAILAALLAARSSAASIAYKPSPVHTGSDPYLCTSRCVAHYPKYTQASAFAQAPHAVAAHSSAAVTQAVAAQQP